ncbi:MAG: SAM-dependent methyltransferase [Gammaproteobacteria bacterium]
MDRIPASFRDPSGFLFRHQGRLLRQVNFAYREHYDLLMKSGLYDELAAAGLLISHRESPKDLAGISDAYRILEPQQVTYVSYPYEWCFSQLKDAALTTLAIQRRALERGMTLKDASAYNIQFHEGRPILIDTLSFERYGKGKPWVAYRQFCQHFLAPLAMMSWIDIRLSQLLERFLDGIPLDLASGMLPRRSWVRPSLTLHIHLHARSIRRHADAPRARLRRKVSALGLEGLIDNLEVAVDRLDWRPEGTEWANYEKQHAYSEAARAEKEHIVLEHLREISPVTVWDLGCNIGFFSGLAARSGCHVLAVDGDPGVVEMQYRRLKTQEEHRILPLWVDLANPSPRLGWAHEERDSLADRGPADLILALALIHHLAFSTNASLDMIAEFFSGLGRDLVIEFVPKSDPQVQRLLVSRVDIFRDYSEDVFERAFSRYFSILASQQIGDSGRRIYRMARI